MVTLFSGAMYNLYKYKKYDDIRLVFAPEFDIAFFGGDPDNFEYPRYDLDISFFRAYENGEPAKIKDYLKWSPTGVKDGDLIFVPGHPGGTSRLLTMDQMLYLRDFVYPMVISSFKSRIDALQKFMALSEENSREAGIRPVRRAELPEGHHRLQQTACWTRTSCPRRQAQAKMR